MILYLKKYIKSLQIIYIYYKKLIYAITIKYIFDG